MTLRLLPISALVFGALLLASTGSAQTPATAPDSAYGGTTVEDIIARVNDQIITRTDYDRAMDEMDQEARQRGDTMQQMSAAHKDLLRSLIDQQLWLSKGKELDITGDTELIKRLDEIRKQYNLATLDDLEKAAQQQGVSYEDFKANIRNGIITQEVMRQEVGEHIQITPGEAEQYYNQHKQDFSQPESERLNEILIAAPADDAAKQAAAKAKADDVETRLRAGGDFAQLARSFSTGPTAASGGDLGQYKRGQLPKVLEDQTFSLTAGQYTQPILTRQGYIILKVAQHTAGGPAPFKDVQDQVEEALYMSRMDPAIRAYLTKMREESFIDIKAGYVDSGASPNETKPVYSAYVPPAPKKKAKVERTRFRESTHTFRQKSPQAAPAAGDEAAAAPAPAAKTSSKKTEVASEKPGKKEKIRFGQAPRETLPTAATTNTATENAGALPETADNSQQPANPLEPAAATQKTRFSARARVPKKPKASTAPSAADLTEPVAPDAGEVADRQTQSGPLGLNGDTSKSKKKKKEDTTTSEKTRLADEKKNTSDDTQKPAPQPTPIAPVAGAPAPADAPQPQH